MSDGVLTDDTDDTFREQVGGVDDGGTTDRSAAEDSGHHIVLFLDAVGKATQRTVAEAVFAEVEEKAGHLGRVREREEGR